MNAPLQEVQNLLRRDGVVSYILDTKTEEIGPRVFRFKAEVAWDGEQLAGRYLARVGRERLVARLRVALKDPNPEAIDAVLKVMNLTPWTPTPGRSSDQK